MKGVHYQFVNGFPKLFGVRCQCSSGFRGNVGVRFQVSGMMNRGADT
jgi:hypothetical protein